MTKQFYLKLPNNYYFDYTFLMAALKEYRAPRDKITLLLKNHEILRIRKGLYIKTKEFGGTVDAINIANAVYGPSYISFQFALSYYAMIPERVETITCATIKRQKTFITPLGAFSYIHVPPTAFSSGLNLEFKEPGNILIASREKALCDQLAITISIRSLNDIEKFITEDLRIEMDDLADFSYDTLDEIEKAYQLNKTSLFVKWYKSKFK
jgi:hypothetical protein